MTRSGHKHRDWLSGSLSMADQVVVSAANFLTIAIISNVCSAADVGVFALSWTVANFFRTAQERIILAPYVNFASHPSTERPSYLGSTLLHGLILACLGMMVVLGLTLGFQVRGDFKQASTMLGLGLTLPVLLMREQIRSISSAHFDFATALGMDCLVTFLQLVVMIGLAAAHRLNIEVAVVAVGLSPLPAIALWGMKSWSRIRIQSERVGQDWNRNWQFSKWLFVARLMSMGGFLLMPWLVAWELNDAAVGAFSVCNSLIGFSLMFVIGANNFFQPKTVREYRANGTHGLVRTVFESIGMVGGVLVAITAVLYFSGGWILGRIYGPAYSQYGTIVCLLSLFTLCMCISIAVSNGLSAMERTQLYLWGEGAFLVTTLVSAWILIPIMELAGASLALVIGGVVVAGINSLLLYSAIKQERQMIGKAVSPTGGRA